MTALNVIFFILMLLISLFTAAVFSHQRAWKTNEYSLFLKTIASICFILLGFVSFWGAAGTVSIAILPGLVMGLVGDIYLDMKYVYMKSNVFYTFIGFGAFILGHLFYLVFLLTQYPITGTGLIISIIIGIIAGFVIYLTPDLMQLNYGRFRLISAIYAALLVFITVYAAALCFTGFTAAKLMFFLGILLFLFSDLVLSQIYFGKDKNTPRNSMLNHASYYLGQILIAASIFAIL